MFTEAGFGTNADAEVAAINRRPDIFSAYVVGVTNEPADIKLVTFSTSEVFTVTANSSFAQRGKDVKPVAVGKDTQIIFSALRKCFDQIGISSEWNGSSNMLKPGECLIWVPAK